MSDIGQDRPALRGVHITVNDHSRRGFVQAHPDDTGPTCATFLADAVARFAVKGITVERVMTDNAEDYTLT